MGARIKSSGSTPFTWAGAVDLDQYVTYGIINGDVPAGVTAITFRGRKGGLEITDIADVQSISAPNLVSHAGDNYVEFSRLAALLSLSAPKLTTATVIVITDNPLMASLNLNALATVNHHIQFRNNDSLVSLSLPELVSITETFNAIDSAALTTISVPKWVMTSGKGYLFSNNALSAATVNHILARAVASGMTSGTIDTSGGTNAAPTGQGITDKAALILAGVTVTTN